jgi:hypothetical protein
MTLMNFLKAQGATRKLYAEHTVTRSNAVIEENSYVPKGCNQNQLSLRPSSSTGILWNPSSSSVLDLIDFEIQHVEINIKLGY